MENNMEATPRLKGVNLINSMTKQELKEKKREYIEFVRAMIGRGYTYTQMVNEIRTQFNVAVRQAKNYIKDTREQINKEIGVEQDKNRADVVTKYNQLYRELYSQGKYEQAGKVLDKYVQLMGLEAPKMLAIKQQVEHLHTYDHLSEQEILDITNRLNNPSNQ